MSASVLFAKILKSSCWSCSLHLYTKIMFSYYFSMPYPDSVNLRGKSFTALLCVHSTVREGQGQGQAGVLWISGD